MLKAVVLILIGAVPSDGSIHMENGGVYTSPEACQAAYQSFQVAAHRAGLAVDRITGVCVVTPFAMPGDPA